MARPNPFDLLGAELADEGAQPAAQPKKPAGAHQQQKKQNAGQNAGAGPAAAQQKRGNQPGSASGPSGASSSTAAEFARRTSLAGGSRPMEYYHAFQKVFVDKATGEVVLRFHRTDILRIRPNGDVLLTTGGYCTQTTLMSMNDGLKPIGMHLEPSGAVQAGNWTLHFDDGSSCPYKDNMTIRARGPADAGRGRAMIHAYTGVSAAAAAAAPAGGHGAQQPRPAAAGGPAPRQAMQPRVAGVAGAGAPSWAPAAPGPAAVAGQAGRAHNAQQQHAHAPQPKATVEQQLAAAAWQAGLHEDDLDDEEACVICLAERRDTVLVPCGHVVLCQDCCTDVMDGGSKECPVCRVPIIEAVQLGGDAD